MATVLSTKCLTEAQQNLILQTGWSLVAYNAIETQQIPGLNYLEKSHFENAIVTSQKTVAILKAMQIDLKNVFCVGQKTALQLKNEGYNVVEVASYGKDLAELISVKYADLKFDFFCGKIRNDELPDLLKKNKVSLTEHHLYETRSNAKTFNRSFDAILFFSPSGVESYYACNSFQGERIICIGKTTASAAKKISTQVEIASKTSIESVIVKLVKAIS